MAITPTLARSLAGLGAVATLTCALGCRGPQTPANDGKAAEPVSATTPKSETGAHAERSDDGDDGAEGPAVPETPPVGLGPAIDAFGADLWQQVRNEPGNLTISPASIHVALTMTWAGAKGTTKTQMGEALHLDELSADLDAAPATGGLLRAWNAAEAITLRTANRLFGHTSYTFEKAYLAAARDDFDAPLERVNFGASEQARAHINDWVAERTESRIKDLIPPNGVDGNTRLVLVNAVYFLADWKTPFDPDETVDGPFHAAGGDVQVPMMKRRDEMAYFEDSQVQVVSLPYVDERYAMTFVLPREGQTLAGIEAELSAGTMAGWFARVDGLPREVDLTVPRFELAPSGSMSLKAPLKQLGIEQAFVAGSADFTAMANPPDPSDRLYVSEVFHKTFVKVDEAGTEAAAATAVVMGRGGGVPAAPPEMTLDRPFLFFIRDVEADATLFMGRVANPG